MRQFISLKLLLFALFLLPHLATAQTAVDLYQQAQEKLGQAQFSESIHLANRAKQMLGKTNPKIEGLLVRAYFRNGDFPDAKIAYEKLLKLSPERVKNVSSFRQFQVLGEQIDAALEKAENEHQQELEQARLREVRQAEQALAARDKARTEQLLSESKSPDYFFKKAKQADTKEAYDEFVKAFGSSGDQTAETESLIKQAKAAALKVDKTYWTEPLRDPRDGQIYKTVRIGNQIWMAENLRYKIPEGSFAYGDHEDAVSYYGRLYTRAAANIVCPDGWHLPDRDDWDELFYTVESDFHWSASKEHPQKFGAYHLMAKSNWENISGALNSEDHIAYDNYGFSVLPAGYRNTTPKYSLIGEFSAFWSATWRKFPGGTESPRSVEFYYGDEYVKYKYESYTSGLSIRCIQDQKPRAAAPGADSMPELIGGMTSLVQNIVYPPQARMQAIEGRVLIHFYVDTEGNVYDASVLEGIGAGCDEEALRVVRRAKFIPGIKDGKPVHVSLAIPIAFQL